MLKQNVAYLLRHLHAVLLHVHDGVGDHHVDGVHHRLKVEGPLEPLDHAEHGVWREEGEALEAATRGSG